jgi:hypothetical protein
MGSDRTTCLDIYAITCWLPLLHTRLIFSFVPPPYAEYNPSGVGCAFCLKMPIEIPFDAAWCSLKLNELNELHELGTHGAYIVRPIDVKFGQCNYICCERGTESGVTEMGSAHHQVFFCCPACAKAIRSFCHENDSSASVYVILSR